jgi:hypothetical protein
MPIKEENVRDLWKVRLSTLRILLGHFKVLQNHDNLIPVSIKFSQTFCLVGEKRTRQRFLPQGKSLHF